MWATQMIIYCVFVTLKILIHTHLHCPIPAWNKTVQKPDNMFCRFILLSGISADHPAQAQSQPQGSHFNTEMSTPSLFFGSMHQMLGKYWAHRETLQGAPGFPLMPHCIKLLLWVVATLLNLCVIGLLCPLDVTSWCISVSSPLSCSVSTFEILIWLLHTSFPKAGLEPVQSQRPSFLFPSKWSLGVTAHAVSGRIARFWRYPEKFLTPLHI